MIYRVYYGPTVPFQSETFTTWANACAFMKRKLDAGVEIHSVHRESKDDQHNNFREGRSCVGSL